MTFSLSPSELRAAVIGVLLFLQALAIPTLTHILGEKAFPDLIEFTGYLIAAGLIVITYLFAFLKYVPSNGTTKESAKA